MSIEGQPATALDASVNKISGFALTVGSIATEVGALALYVKFRNIIPSVLAVIAGLYGLYVARGYFQQAREIQETQTNLPQGE